MLRDARFTIIEKIENIIKTTSILETHEDKMDILFKNLSLLKTQQQIKHLQKTHYSLFLNFYIKDIKMLKKFIIHKFINFYRLIFLFNIFKKKRKKITYIFENIFKHLWMKWLIC